MIRIGIKICIGVLLCASTVSGEESPRNERNPAGTLINQDYFSAQRYPEVRYLLFSLEKHHLNAGVWADYSSGKLSAVLSDVTYILERMPNHPKALELLGSVAKLMDKTSLAVPYYEKALSLYPQYALTYAQYGGYLVDIGQIDAGIGRLEKAIEIDPKLALAHARLAKAYFKKGDREFARRSGERARALGYRGRLAGQGSEE